MWFNLGYPQFALILSLPSGGVSWEQASASKESGIYGDIPVFYIGKSQYVANKKATGRTKDIADIEALGEEE